MRRLTQLRHYLVVGAILGLLMPPATFAGQHHRNSPIRDVALQHDGTLRGTVLSVQGQSAAGTTISLVADGKLVAKVSAGTDGKFVIEGLRPGVYSIVAGASHSALRLWSETAAPPAATPELLLVEQQAQVVRGARGGRLPRWDHPILVGGLLLSAGVIGGVIGYNVRDFDPAS